jgi:isopenicillin-N epimerase
MRDLFLLDPDVVFLNHGSFGACPLPVFEVFQHWQREMERQPVEFFIRRSDELLDEATTALAAYLNADPHDITYVTNATVGINMIARSLPLQPGDEVLTTDHEYGAVDNTWQFVCQQTGADYVRHSVALPVETPDTLVESFWESVTPRTRVIAISHITSPTALRFPLEAICRRAREAGILTVIDGAHAPGQIPLDLPALGADFYAGNCHKWLCAPKSAGFVYARREHHTMIVPPVISWGWKPDSTFVTRTRWQGTRDLAAFLSVPTAIDFLHQHNWDQVRRDCHALVVQTRERIAELTGLPPIAPESWFNQMVTVPLPPCDASALAAQMYAEFRVEVVCLDWRDRQYLRASFQGYNTQADADALVDALAAVLRRGYTELSTA